MAKETRQEYFQRMLIQYERIEKQNVYLRNALLKLQLMGLTPENGVVELEVPEGITPERWKAMVIHAYREGVPGDNEVEE